MPVESNILYVRIYSFLDYWNMKVTGRVYFTLTFCPFSFPGVQFGIDLTTRSASLSRAGVTPFAIIVLLTFPSASTTKVQITRPCSPFDSDSSGYFTVFVRYCIKACMPPGNSGISSTTSKTLFVSSVFDFTVSLLSTVCFSVLSFFLALIVADILFS